jgi:hypothetical protein
VVWEQHPQIEDHGNRNRQCDDDLMLHSTLNISTSTVSNFFFNLYTLQHLADAPNSEIDHDHGDKFST